MRPRTAYRKLPPRSAEGFARPRGSASYMFAPVEAYDHGVRGRVNEIPSIGRGSYFGAEERAQGNPGGKKGSGPFSRRKRGLTPFSAQSAQTSARRSSRPAGTSQA